MIQVNVTMEFPDELCDIDYSVDEPWKDVYQNCYDGNLERVKYFVEVENVNIYKFVDNFRTPLTMAISTKKQNVVNFLLDIYERDLEALNGTKFTKALIALPEDQTEELFQTVEEVLTDNNVIPVLLKTGNTEKPKVVYLRKILKNKDDSSLRLAKKLEEKNDFCDINCEPTHPNAQAPLLSALCEKMNQVVERLLKFPTIDKNLINKEGNSSLALAILGNNLKAVEKISDGNSHVFIDKSLLSFAVRSRNTKMIEYVVKKMMEKLPLKEILLMGFDFHEYKSPYKLFHEICRYNLYDFFMKHQLPFDENDFCIQDDNGDTILHHMMDHLVNHKNDLKRVWKYLTIKYPRLLTIRNKRNYLPLHVAVKRSDDKVLTEMVYAKTVEIFKNENIFCEDVEIAVSCLEAANALFMGTHDEVEALLEKLMNGKLRDILESHGTRMLHQHIAKYSCHNFKGLKFLLAQKKFALDLNDCYNGMNAYSQAFYQVGEYYGKGDAMKIFRILCEYQPLEDFNAADVDGKTIFMNLCEFSADSEEIKSIIATTPNCVTNKSHDGSTCFHFVHKNSQNEEIVDILLENGADPNQADNAGNIPIIHAIYANNTDMFETLLELTSDEDLNKHYGINQETVLHAASITFVSRIIDKLLTRNVNFLAINYHGSTPLHFDSQCSMSSCEKILNQVISKKIKFNINQQNNEGDTPLHSAVEKSMFEISVTILENFHDEIDFNIINNKKQTITHHLVTSYHFKKYVELFGKFPKLSEAFKQQIDIEDHEGTIPLQFLIHGWRWQSEPVFEIIANNIELEKIKKNFHLFVNHFEGLKVLHEKYPELFEDETIEKLLNFSVPHMENSKAFDFLLSIISADAFAKVHESDKNILHLICSKNDERILDSTIKFLTENQLKNLLAENDKEGKKPFDLLNNEKKIFSKY